MSKSGNYLRTSISLPPAICKWLESRARKFGITMSGYVVQLLIEDMKQQEKPIVSQDLRPVLTGLNPLDMDKISRHDPKDQE